MASYILLEQARHVEALVLDVDGILSDGFVTLTNSGDEIKNFDKLKDIINIGDEVFLESAEPYAYYCEHNNKISHAKYSLKNIYIGSNFPKKI